uniref:Uncharacterized protein n=1 Tax=Rhizophora mucronata TaxID=61149 RepID=A0A2P2L6W9_RHIMU
MSSAIPKALFSMVEKAPAAVALLQRPSESSPRPSSRYETLISTEKARSRSRGTK